MACRPQGVIVANFTCQFANHRAARLQTVSRRCMRGMMNQIQQQILAHHSANVGPTEVGPTLAQRWARI